MVYSSPLNDPRRRWRVRVLHFDPVQLLGLPTIPSSPIFLQPPQAINSRMLSIVSIMWFTVVSDLATLSLTRPHAPKVGV
jgi:hypothetical protein